MKNGIENLIKNFDRFGYYLDQKIDRDIEENRKGCFTLVFRDEKGNLLENVRVKVRQKKHEFRFGCAAFYLDQYNDAERNKAYREKFKEIFNYAVIPFYWDTLEPCEGNPRFDQNSSYVHRRPPVDTMMDFCKENGIRAKGNC